MKAKILILGVVLASMLESCASHCGNKSWRTQRFVQHEPAAVMAKPAV